MGCGDGVVSEGEVDDEEDTHKRGDTPEWKRVCGGGVSKGLWMRGWRQRRRGRGQPRRHTIG